MAEFQSRGESPSEGGTHAGSRTWRYGVGVSRRCRRCRRCEPRHPPCGRPCATPGDGLASTAIDEAPFGTAQCAPRRVQRWIQEGQRFRAAWSAFGAKKRPRSRRSRRCRRHRRDHCCCPRLPTSPGYPTAWQSGASPCPRRLRQAHELLLDREGQPSGSRAFPPGWPRGALTPRPGWAKETTTQHPASAASDSGQCLG